MDQVVGSEERHCVKWPAVDAAAFYWPAVRLGPDETLDGRDEGLQSEKRVFMMEPWWVGRRLAGV